MQTLRDKLLKAGLVTEDQVKKVQDAAPPKTERPPRPESGRPDRRPSSPSASRPHRPRPASPAAASTGPFITARPQPLRAGGAEADSRIPKLPPLPGSKAHQRLESLKQVEQERELRELVHAHEVPLQVGATVFYFVTRKGKLRRLELQPAQAQALEKGELAIVERPEPGQIEHSLVPAEAALQMQALSAKAVRFFNRPGAPVGFLSDDDITGRQAREAAGEPDVEEPSASTEVPAAAVESPRQVTSGETHDAPAPHPAVETQTNS